MTGNTQRVGVPCLFETVLEFVGKQQVCQFALPVGFPLTVGVLSLEVLEVNGSGRVGGTGMGNNPCFARSFDEQVQQMPGQREMTQMIYLALIVITPVSYRRAPPPLASLGST